MRLFTAVDIPNEVKSALAAAIERLRPIARIKWTDLDKLHITTKFIGEWSEDRMPELMTALRGAGSPGAIQVAVRGFRWAPDARHPRMLWAGVEASPALVTLAHETEEVAYALGVPREDRKFSPHLTVARVREGAPLDILRQAIPAGTADDFGSFTASAFYLYRSQDGVYTKLIDFSLV